MGKSFLLLIFIFLSCSTRNVSVPLSFNRQTECIATNPDGSIIIKSWGIGKDSNSSRMNAITIGLNDVLFNGISKGQSECSLNPILSLAKKKEFEAYFYNFFNNTPEINKFVTETKSSKPFSVNNNQITSSVVMKINYYELKSNIFRDLNIIQ